MKLTEEEMLAQMKRHYKLIIANVPNSVTDFCDWMNALPVDERDQYAEYAKANDNENAPWRK